MKRLPVASLAVVKDVVSFIEQRTLGSQLYTRLLTRKKLETNRQSPVDD